MCLMVVTSLDLARRDFGLHTKQCSMLWVTVDIFSTPIRTAFSSRDLPLAFLPEVGTHPLHMI